MAVSNTKRERRIYSIFSLDQLNKILLELSRASPPEDNWYLHAQDGDWKEYVSASKQLRFREEISREEIERLLGPAAIGTGDNQFEIEEWRFYEFSDVKYDYIFCVSISFIDNIAVSGLVRWRKITRE